MTIKNDIGMVAGIYCGQQNGKKIIIAGEFVQIVFHSNENHQRQGFRLRFSFAQNGKFTHTYINISKT